MPLGNGRVRFGSDFTGASSTAVDAGAGALSLFGVGTEVYSLTTTTGGGILAFSTGGSDDDNAVITAGPARPKDGLMTVRTRFRYSNVDCAIFFGWSKTLDTTTPVMPAEFATATMTYNGTGGMVGFNYDVDGTTDDFRAVMGDAGAARSDSSNGIRSNATVTASRFFESVVSVFPDGSAECWFAHSGNSTSDKFNKLVSVKRFSTGTLLTNTDFFFPVLMIENRSGTTRKLEVDFFEGEYGRNWAYDA